ncbi:MAG: hypothetical protein GOU99_00525 [Candidatus Altiarchaeota archaeon]|nr:hypothetical protein [Candidatus Altiarchaeota archaeon]
MIDLILLGLTGFGLVKFGFVSSWLIALAAGLLIGLFFGGFSSIIKLIPATLVCLSVPIGWALANQPGLLISSGITGLLLLIGYAIGAMVAMILTPVKWIMKILKKIF